MPRNLQATDLRVRTLTRLRATPCPPPQCDHHEGGPYPACPSICSPGECATPACPADSANPKCSEAGYTVATWAKDKHFAKKAYGVSGVDAIMTDIMTNGPVSASFTVYSDLLTYKSGVYSKTAGATPVGGHAVKILGWGNEGGQESVFPRREREGDRERRRAKRAQLARPASSLSRPRLSDPLVLLPLSLSPLKSYWIVDNSWNTYWGDRGYFKMLKGVNECGIESDIVTVEV